MDVYNLSWSADSKYLAFDYRAELHESTRIGVIENRTGKLTDIVYSAWSLVWSPDSKQVLYISQSVEAEKGEIHLIKDITEAIRKFRPDYHRLTNTIVGDGTPAWSPDGKKIAFSSIRDGNAEIYVIGADGSNPARLTNNPEWDAYPAWSPDGKQIAFVSNRDGNQEIYVMDADGSHLLRLTNNDIDDWAPVWQPQP